jgi:hypothetical protein
VVSVPAGDRARLRQYAQRWREVQAMQESLIRAEPPAGPRENLARGLALIALARRSATAGSTWKERDEGVAEARRSWQRLRACWAR